MGEKLPSAKRLDLEAKVNPLWATHESWTRSLDVGEGWLDLVSDLVDELLSFGAGFEVLQIKEKFGGLRFYVRYTEVEESQKLRDIIQKYERLSYETCEVCGEPGRVREGYWARTLCDKDAEPKVQSVQDGCVDE
jgi:hypothetical protein